MSVNAAMTIAGIVAATVLRDHLRRLNKRLDQGGEGRPLLGGDRRRGFRFLI
jgi:hypothetical protein